MEAVAAVVVVVVADAVVVVGKNMNARAAQTKLGLAWRPELSRFITESADITFSEILAEDFWNIDKLPREFELMHQRGIPVIPHGVSLSLGGAKRPDPRRLDKMAKLAEKVGAPFVSEHFAFVRAGKLESGHLLPFKRNQLSLELVAENIAYAQARLPVPLCLENIACLADWPEQEISEVDFISSIVKETGIGLLLDVANLYANCRNFGLNSSEYLDRLPLEKIFYVHVAGGCMIDGLYHDTHCHRLQNGPMQVLEDLTKQVTPPAVLLERDDELTSLGEIRSELDLIQSTLKRAAWRSVA